MPPRTAEPTPAELPLLQALWRLRQATGAEVRAALPGSPPAYTTVMTLLGRLEAKGLVKVDKAREPFVYRPRASEAAVVRGKVKRLVDTLFGGSAEALVLRLVEEEALSEEDLKRIEARLAARKEGRR